MLCWYRRSEPVLVLKPQKMERAWLSPEIFLLRDILTDKEVELIKQHAYPLVSLCYYALYYFIWFVV